MNIHPIFVHFPVALLTVYSVLELVRLRKISGQPYWFYVKALFVIFGVLGAYAAFVTGDGAAEAARPDRHILGLHENWAATTVTVYSLLAGSYVVAWINRTAFSAMLQSSRLSWAWSFLSVISRACVETKFSIILALLGLVSVTVTGILGGSMVYGPSADPFISFVYTRFIQQ